MKDIWIFSRTGGVYISFWLAITAVYQALFMLTPDTDYARAANASLAIIGTAALLGVIVVTVALRHPQLPKWRPGLVAAHATGAVLYSSLWILAVMTTRNIGVWLENGEIILCTPPTHVIRWHIVAGSALYAAMISAVYAMRATAMAEAKREHAELRALRAQLNPHFMFNTLHTISMLFRRDTSKAEAALEAFSDIVRYALHPPKPLGVKAPGDPSANCVQLRGEWEAATRYIELETLRLGDRLRTHICVADDTLVCAVPALTLQPILENAVVHGAAAREDGADVWVAIKKRDTTLEISVKNQCPPRHAIAVKQGIGLTSVIARLETAFSKQASITYGHTNDDVFEVRITLPCSEGAA